MMVSDDGHRLAFDKRELAVLTGMMAKEDRPALAALWLHGARAQAWATDGHRAVIVERDDKPRGGDPKAQPVAIPAVTAHHVAKTAGTRDLVVIDSSGPEVTIELRERNDRTTEINTFDEIEGRTRPKHAVTCKRHEGVSSTIEWAFPSCRERGAKGLAVPFDPGLLAPVMALASITGGFVWLNIGDDDGPILFLATGEDGAVWRLLVMPRRPGTSVPPDREPPPMPGAKPRSRAKPTATEPTATEPAAAASPVATEPAKPRRGGRPRKPPAAA